MNTQKEQQEMQQQATEQYPPIQYKLAWIQQQLVCGKESVNTYAGYTYRTTSAIITALKPLMQATGTLLTMTDDVIECGGRVYIKATVTLKDATTGAEISAQAFAREDQQEKGKSGCQITGSASTYARKYALGGLLGLDDRNADPDGQDNTGR